MTVSQVRVALAALLQTPPVNPRILAARITGQLRRNEEARRARWHARGLTAPRRMRIP
jgi:hypothetical protein